MAEQEKGAADIAAQNRAGPVDYRALRAEQLRLLYDPRAPAALLQPLCALIICYLYSDHALVDTQLLYAWALLSVGLLGVRTLAVHGYTRKPPATPRQMLVYRQVAVGGALAMGSLLGFASVVFNPSLFVIDEGIVYHQIMMVTLLGGLVVAGVASYSVYLPAFFAYTLTAVLPGGIYLGLSGVRIGELFFLVDLLFAGFLVFAAMRINAMTMESLMLRFRNEALVGYLDRARADAEALNSKLAREIYERKKMQHTLRDAHDKLESLVGERTAALQHAYDELARGRERLALAMEASDIGLWDWNLATDEVFHSNFDRMLGYSNDELKTFRGHLQPLVHEEDYPRIRAAMVAHLKGRTERYQMTYRTRHKNGSWRWVEDNGRVVAQDDRGRALRMIGTRRDVTAQREAEEQLTLAARVFDTATEAIFILDRRFRFLKINSVFTRITGYAPDEVLGKTLEDLNRQPAARETYREISAALKDIGTWQGELVETRKDGSSYPEWLQVSAVRDERGVVTHYVGIFSDLTARREAEEKLRYLSNYDKVTGLANRTLFRDRLHAAINEARLRRGNLALLYIDLDRFKQINDTLGHEVGDRLLGSAATRLMELDLQADTLCRIGGDEFTIILADYKDRAALGETAERIIEAMRAPFYIDNHELIIGTSIGIALFPEHARELQVLINNAEQAVRQAKRLGGNSVQFHVADSRGTSIDSLTLETSLRKAIFRNEFVVYYQPKYDLIADRITGVEALVRWQHPTRGILAPKDFIPLAEETGLIAAIGELVLERAARQVTAWRDIGLGDIRVSVNLSAHQVRKGNLVEVVERVIYSSGLPPEMLELEITESQLMEDLDNTIRMLQTLRKRGVAISLDDFGTGYSSLSYLKRFPIDTVKIDQSFVRDLHKSDDDAAIVRAIIAMAHTLNIKVMAEGVEAQAHMDFLRQAGCDGVQGYLISRPVPEQDLIPLLRSQINVA